MGEAMNASPFQIRGVVEGFYGVYYTFPERNDLLRFLGRHGYNSYIYGPKNDRQHRARWWQPYPDEVMAQFAETVAIAREAGISFCYAIAPITYENDDDLYRGGDQPAGAHRVTARISSRPVTPTKPYAR